MRAGVQRHAPVAVPPVPIHTRPGGPQGAENLAHTRIRSPDRPARSEWLYRLSYPGPQSIHKREEKILEISKLRKVVIFVIDHK